MKRAIIMNSKDNVVTAVDDLEIGDKVTLVSIEGGSLQEINAIKAIPFGHKIARCRLSKETEVIKYGEVIGVALQDIEVGDHVHVHNVKSARLGVQDN